MNLEAVVGRADAAAIEHGAALLAFAEAVTRGSDEIDAARAALRAALGEAGFIEAAGIVGIFNGLVRTADLSGIPLDDGTLHGSADAREKLGLNGYSGAANSALDRADAKLAPERVFAPPSR